MTRNKTTAAQGTVYALIDPRDGATRYIGQTTKTLPARLSGHMASPAPNVAAWIAELRAAGAVPAIAPLHQDVPTSILLRLEREEITRRLLEGEQLLNEGATSDARKTLAKLKEEQRVAQNRAAWQEAAHRTRAALFGPLPSGDIPAAPFPENVWRYMPDLWKAQDALEEARANSTQPFDPDLWRVEQKVMDAEKRLSSQLWEGVRAGWPSVRGRDDKLDKRLEAMVSGTVSIRCETLEEASRLVTLAPWCLIAVAPWAALAQRAGLSLDTDDFITWVTDRPEVEEALRFVCQYRPRMLEHLAGMEHANDRQIASIHLVAAAAAHMPFDLSSEITHSVTNTLRDIARDKMLTNGMADLLARLDPQSLDDLFGTDVARAADASLGLPAGTSAAVIKHLMESSYGNFGVLDQVLARAAGKLPSKAYPDYSTWSGRGVATTQAITETLYASGLVTGSEVPDLSVAEAAARSLWACDLESISWHAGH